MKLLPLIGALLISAVPVHAFETVEDLNKACRLQDPQGDVSDLCYGVAAAAASSAISILACQYFEKLTPEDFNIKYNSWVSLVLPEGFRGSSKPGIVKKLWNEVIKDTQISYPNCPIKLIP